MNTAPLENKLSWLSNSSYKLKLYAATEVSILWPSYIVQVQDFPRWVLKSLLAVNSYLS